MSLQSFHTNISSVLFFEIFIEQITLAKKSSKSFNSFSIERIKFSRQIRAKQPYVKNRFSLKSSNQKFIASGQTSRVRFSRRVHNCKNVAGKRGRGGCAVKSANLRNNARDFKTNDVNPFCKPRYAIAVLADFIM